jgi:hypothetical protein
VVRFDKTVSDIELQLQYTNYKNGLQQIAQKIGDVEQEAEEHSTMSPFHLQSEVPGASVCSTAQFQGFFYSQL